MAVFDCKQSIRLLRQADFVDAAELVNAFDSISHLEVVYPGFCEWIDTKVILGLRDGSRNVFVERVQGRICGVAIAKRTVSERKLCTLWVDRDARAAGVAGRLANEVFGWLGTEKPLFTVPDVSIDKFRSLLDRWGFAETQVVPDIYRPGGREFVFNGILRLLS